MAEGTYAGEKPHASRFSLPAATTTVTPAFTAASTATSRLTTFPDPPRLMLATAGRSPLRPTQSRALMDQDQAPEPASLSTLTPCTLASEATP